VSIDLDRTTWQNLTNFRTNIRRGKTT